MLEKSMQKNSPSSSSNTSPMVLSLVLASLAALAPFAIDTYLPAFPTLENALESTSLQIQQSLTFYLLPYALMTLFHGAISDAVGRITTIKWGLGVFALASVGCGFCAKCKKNALVF